MSEPTTPPLERLITFTPAYDRRDPDPSKSYGIGSVVLRFAVRGPLGGVSFHILTGWYLPHIDLPPKPTPASIDYHSPTRRHDYGRHNCDLCPPNTLCYSDGSALAGQELFRRFLAEGDSAVWEVLEQWYHDCLTSPPPT